MTADRWQQIKVIFDSALELVPEERRSYLQQACAGDTELRSEVERLLQEWTEAGSFLDIPVFASGPALSSGDVLSGRVEIIRLLGEGGMGEVYEAVDRLDGVSYALKTLHAGLAENEAVLRRFQKEIQLARKVTHPNVCRIYEAGVHRTAGDDNKPLLFFTMELLNGETLAARIHRTGRLRRDEAFPLARQMAAGLAAAHEAGVVHRDFKSGNVMLIGAPGSERAVVTDFGLAGRDRAMAATAESASTMAAGRVLDGTIGYMSPEQLAGEEVTAASDIYSFGIVLFEMAAGRLPFDPAHPIRAAVQRATGEIAPLRSLVPEIDPRWEAAIERCLEHDPQRRFRSAAELHDWFSDQRLQLPRLYWSRRQWLAAGTGAALAAAAGGVAWMRLHQPYRPVGAALQWYTKAVQALHSMTYETARKELEQAVTADPRFALGYARLAEVYGELDYSERAKDTMLKAISIAEEGRLSQRDHLRMRALQSVVSREYDRAAPLFQELESSAPEQEKAEAALESGWVEEKAGDTSKAIEAYTRVKSLDPQYSAAILRLGVMLSRARRVDEALKSFSEAEGLYDAASDYEGLTEALFQEATLLNRSGRNAGTTARIQKAIAITGATKNVYQQIRLRLLESGAYRNAGEADRATAIAQEAVDAALQNGMESMAARALLDLGNAFFVRREPESAERYFQQGLKVARESKSRQSEARGLLALGSLRVRYNRMEEAKPFIEAAIAIYGPGGYRRELAQASLLLGSSQTELGELEEGAGTLSETAAAAEQLGDRDLTAQVRAAYGSALEARGAWPAALEEYEKSSQLRAGMALAITRLDCANLYWRLGRVEDAERTFFEAGVLIEKEKGERQELRTRLLRRRAEMAFGLGRFADAARLARQAIEEAGEKEVAEGRAASLIAGLAAIRMGSFAAGAARCNEAIQAWVRERRPVKAAYAQLLLGKTLALAGGKREASRNARAALDFFEPRRVDEAIWQARWVEGEGGSAESGELARAAVKRLKSQWPRDVFDGYIRANEKSGVSMSWFDTGSRVLK